MTRMCASEPVKSKILNVLATGCDERIFIDPKTGVNRYHLNPVEFETLFQRGSCTANTLTNRSFGVAKAFLGKYGELNYESLLETQGSRLRRLVQNEFNDPFDVFFAPSGSDLMYYPLMFQRMLNPLKRLVNIVSCPEELGSGSRCAAETRFYANYNQFGESVRAGNYVDPEHVSDVHYLDARSPDGFVLERSGQINDLVSQHRDAAVVGSLVFGSKSGIKDDLEVINPEDGIVWVVDLCQFRVDQQLIHELLEKGALVMLTGSKFFEAPPFCAALLVPRRWTERLRDADATVIKPYEKLFSAYDVPWVLQNIRAQFPKRENKGLRLRFEIALDEMEAYSHWSVAQANDVIARWNQAVMSRLASSPQFRLMPDQHMTNPSIISFQVWVKGRALNGVQLKALFKTIVTTEHQGFDDGLSRVFFGQPVEYGERSFIRLAIGAHCVREMLEMDELKMHNDYRLIEVIEEHAERLFG